MKGCSGSEARPSPHLWAGTIGLSALAATLIGCQSANPSCGSDQAKELVSRIALDQLEHGMSPVKVFERPKSKLSLQAVRTQQSSTHQAECLAAIDPELSFLPGVPEEFAAQLTSGLRRQISYTVQITDDGKSIYVSLRD